MDPRMRKRRKPEQNFRRDSAGVGAVRKSPALAVWSCAALFVPVHAITAGHLTAAMAAAVQPVSAWSEADLAAADALRDKAAAGTLAFEHVSSLVTEVGPRSAGSAGDATAVRWAMNKLASLGFSNVRSQDVLVPHWVRGTAQVEIAAPFPQTLVAAYLAANKEGDFGRPPAAQTAGAAKK